MKINIDSEIIKLRCTHRLPSKLIFFKSWSYQIELPLRSIRKARITNRFGIKTLMIYKGKIRIPFCLTGASANQLQFIQKVLIQEN